LRTWAHENHPRPLTGAGKLRVFREEAVTGVNRVNPLLLRHPDDALDVEVSGDRPLPFPDLISLVGLVAMDAQPILLRINRDSPQTELGAGAEDAHRNLAAIGSH